MKFLVTWAIEQDKWLPITTKWVSMSSQERADPGEGVEIIGRWHAIGSHTGVLILQSDNLAAVQRYIGRWNPFMDITIEPVVDDEEAAKIGRQILADHNPPSRITPAAIRRGTSLLKGSGTLLARSTWLQGSGAPCSPSLAITRATSQH